MLANLLAQFQAQTYRPDLRRLFILDDAGQFGQQKLTTERGWIHFGMQDFDLWSTRCKFPTLPAKYAWLVERALRWGADAFVAMDDDDIYLPEHVENHARVLAEHGWSHPRTAYAMCSASGAPIEENAENHFHGALAFRRDYGERVAYWGPVDDGHMGADVDLLLRLRAISPPGQHNGPPTYFYRWQTTGADHCSGRYKNATDTSWYDNTPISQPGHWDELRPEMDAETRTIYQNYAGWKSSG